MTFDLLVQASGRSGRSSKGGDVVIQVYNPEHYAIINASKQNYLRFFKQEMKFRSMGKYPPYRYFISFIAQDKEKDKAFNEALRVKNYLLSKGEMDILGPSDILKHQDYYRFRLLYRGSDLEKMKMFASMIYEDRKSNKNQVRLVIDINPLNLEE